MSSWGFLLLFLLNFKEAAQMRERYERGKGEDDLMTEERDDVV
jgi:hypothetical protein